MTPQQKELWEKLTNQAKESGMDNLHARQLYDEISKLINMSDKVLLSITEKEDGLEVRVADAAYGNLALVGLLEKIKSGILDDLKEMEEPTLLSGGIPKKKESKYDA